MFNKEILQRVKNYNDFIKINSLDFFESDKCPENINIIYSELAKNNVNKLNFNDVLKENLNILEFFILDLWEKIRESSYISIQALYNKTKSLTQKDKEILGAIESVISGNIKKME